MSTQATVRKYFDALQKKSGWEAFLADDMTFTSHTSPLKEAAGKAAYLQATKRFYSTIAAVEVRELLVDGEHACALTHYAIRPPVGAPFTSDVAEIFTVKSGKIAALAIYFDTAPFPKTPPPA